jgi:hypothetical protein
VVNTFNFPFLPSFFARWRPLLVVALVAPLWNLGDRGGGACSADTVELSGGGHLSGQARTRGDVTVVKVDDRIQVAVPASRVRRTVEANELSAYRERAAAAADDAEQHYQLAIWCGGNVPGESDFYKRFHMERAIQIDSDHSKARAWLGYKLQQGEWVLTSELMRDRGMIRRGSGWEMPEAIAISEGQQTANTETKKWIREVKRLVKVSNGRNDQKAQEAIDTLAAIVDPNAATAIAQQLKESRGDPSQRRELRQLWVDLLGRFHNRDAIEALVFAGVDEPDAVIREQALVELSKFGSQSAVATYLPMLRSSDNEVVNRAARALAWFPDSELALTYVEALVTEHKTVAPAGPAMQIGFGESSSGNSSRGMSMGGKPQVTIQTKQNPAVLSLLRELETEVDYGYDEQAWLEYFASKRGQFTGDLRRDP